MGINGTPRKRFHKWKFVVEIEGVSFAGFQSVSGLEVEIATVSISEGGSMIPNKSPGRATFAKITLSRGATSDRDLYDWYLEVARIAANVGQPDPVYVRDFDIVQQDRNGEELQRWRVFGAWPSKFSAGDWDNESDEFRIESVELEIDRFDLV